MPTSARPSDEDLARQAQAGCMASFEELVRRFQVPLVHFLRQGAQSDEADDLAQDTFLKAYENLHRYNGSSRFSTWLFTIGRRLYLNARRRVEPDGATRLAETVEAREPPPPKIAADREHYERLWHIASRLLSEPEYTAVWLHYVEGMATAEIGPIVGRSRVAVKTMLFRSRQKLVEALSLLDPNEQPTSPRHTPTHKAATGGRAP